MADNGYKIHVSNLKKNFGKLEVLRGISLDGREGEGYAKRSRAAGSTCLHKGLWVQAVQALRFSFPMMWRQT